MPDRDSWELAEGDEVAPGRHAVRHLGGGRRYEAYLVWDDELWALVVAKLLRPSLTLDPASVRALAREASALECLNHPAIVRSFGSMLDGDRPHVVLEYLDGPRLSTLIRRFGVILEQALPLALELCSALQYMHRRGLVHLDVKPRNVIMTAPPRLIDLSVATPIAEVANLSAPTGTDAYMAPEQCDSTRFADIGPASDVWGLGVTLYEALAKRLPFTAAEGTYPQLVGEPEPLDADVPKAIAAAVMACLAEAPADRPTAVELAELLEPWVARLPQARIGLFRPGGTTRRGVFEIA